MSLSLKTLHKYWKSAAMAATSYTGDSPLFLVDYLLRAVRVVVLLSIWRVVFAGKTDASGLTLEEVLTYTLIAEVFAEQLTPRTNLTNALWDGSIATHMLRPISLFGQFFAEMFGRWLFGLGIFSLPLLFIAPLLRVHPEPASLGAALAFVPSLALGVSVGLAIEFIFGPLMIYLEQSSWAIDRLRLAVGTLLSGALLPLALLPWHLGAI